MTKPRAVSVKIMPKPTLETVHTRATDNADVDKPASVWVAPSDLKPWAENPRLNDGEPVKRVMESIQRFGFGAPIVVRAENMEIIAGHTRWKAACALKLAHVPVRLLDISEREAHLLALADNRLTELTDWSDSLATVLSDFSLQEASVAGWQEKDLEAMAKALLGAEPADEEEAVPDVPSNPVTKPGDAWRLGRHTVVCGDCRDIDTVKRLVGEHRINLAFTSPPYASQRKYDESSGFKPIAPDDFVEWFESVQANVRAVLADDGSWFVNIKPHSDGLDTSLYVIDLVAAHVRRWGWHFATEYAWQRAGMPGKPARRFKNQFEPVYQFARNEWKFRPEAVKHASDDVPTYDPKNHWASGLNDTSAGSSGSSWVNVEGGTAYPGNLLPVGRTADGTGHVAAFSVSLPQFFIRAYTDPSDCVYDPFLGSGTTLIAAEQLDRTCFGTELSPAYCDVIVERWQNLTGGKAERVG